MWVFYGHKEMAYSIVLLKKASSRAAVPTHAIGCGRKNISVVVDTWPKSHVLEKGGQNTEGKGSRTSRKTAAKI